MADKLLLGLNEAFPLFYAGGQQQQDEIDPNESFTSSLLQGGLLREVRKHFGPQTALQRATNLQEEFKHGEDQSDLRTNFQDGNEITNQRQEPTLAEEEDRPKRKFHKHFTQAQIDSINEYDSQPRSVREEEQKQRIRNEQQRETYREANGYLNTIFTKMGTLDTYLLQNGLTSIFQKDGMIVGDDNKITKMTKEDAQEFKDYEEKSAQVREGCRKFIFKDEDGVFQEMTICNDGYIQLPGYGMK